VDDSSNLQWVKIALNGVILYGTYDPIALIDGEVQSVQFRLDATTNSTVVTIPHFWYSAEFDPSFQVLVDTSQVSFSCGKSVANDHGLTASIIGAIVGSVVGASAIVLAVMIFLRRKMRQNSGQNLRSTLDKINAENPYNLTPTTTPLTLSINMDLLNKSREGPLEADENVANGAL